MRGLYFMKTVTRKRDLFLLLVCVVILAGIPAVAADETAISVTTLPLSIIENIGQKDPSVLFHADAAGHAIFFTADEVLLARMDQESGTSSIVGIGLAGSNPGAEVKGIDPLAGKANFFIGSDPSGWFTAVPMYGGVAYEEILAGVDLLFRGDQGMLKREFVLAPATDPRTVVMKYRGHESLALDDSGRLLVTTSTGVLTESAPFAYQEINGHQTEVACRYVILGEDRVGFVLGEYNGAFPVVIDPYLEYSTYFGGWGEEIGYGVDVDDTGCAYITGSSDSTSIVLPPHSVYQETLAGGKDAFIAKFSEDGTDLEYFTFIGGAYDDISRGIAVDSSYQATITGYTYSSDFPVLSEYQTTTNNFTDIFLARIDATGGSLVYSTYLGGNKSDWAYGIALDSSEDPVITGYTSSTDFPTASPLQDTLTGGTDVIVAGISGGSTLSFSTYLGGERDDKGYAVALDSNDYIFVTGTTRSLIFNTTSSAFRKNLRGEQDAFITKFNPTASSLEYSTYLGGLEYDGGRGIAVDAAGDAYVTGFTDSPSTPLAYTFPLRNPYQSTYGGGSSSSLHYGDAFITKMSNDGSALNYSTYLGGRANEVGYAIAVDNLTRAHVTGWTDSMDFPTERALYDSLNGIMPDAFIAQLSAEGNVLDFSTYFGGSYYDEGYGIHSDDAGNVTITGYTQSPVDFPVMNAYQDQLAGSPSIRNEDAFVSRIARIIPVASFTADPMIGFVPLSVDFTDTSTGDPITWDWEFGDGGISAVQNPTHLYEVVGNYTVNLTVCNLDGCDNTSGIIYVGPELIPDFEANETSGCRDLIVNFTDLTTPVFGDYGEPTNKTWDFGDGNVTEVTTDQFIIHTYTEAGVYNVTLNVTSFFGMAVHTKDAYIAVNETPVADFTSNATIGFAPLTVQFEDNSTGYPGPSSWYWELTPSTMRTVQGIPWSCPRTGR
jgi:PKD repeat protein